MHWCQIPLRRLPGHARESGSIYLKAWGARRTVFIPKTGEVSAQGLLIRWPESLRPLTLCNCECKILTAAMCSGLRRYSVECVHPSQRCVTQRVMTDNIFEIETAIACAPAIRKTLDFSCAYRSVDHRWIFRVLRRASGHSCPRFSAHAD